MIRARKANDEAKFVTDWVQVGPTLYRCECCGQSAHIDDLVMIADGKVTV